MYSVQLDFAFVKSSKLRIRLLRYAILGGAAFVLAGCHSSEEPGKYQVMAKVNGQEITVPEVNQYIDQMKSYRGTKEQIRRNAVDAVINQHLMIAAAKNESLDKNPMVMQMLLLSQKKALIKAYLDDQLKTLPTPTSAEISSYYQSHPLLFAERALYVVNHYEIEANFALQQKLLSQLQSSKNTTEFFNELDKNHIAYDAWQTVEIPGKINQAELTALAKMSVDGVLVVEQTRTGMELLVMVSKIPAPIPLNRAQLAITTLLTEQEKARATAALLQNLRQHARIQYLDQ